jgi:TPR repeat protein
MLVLDQSMLEDPVKTQLATSVLAVLFCALSLVPNTTQALTEPELKGEVASLYNDGEYKDAYKQYLKMAKDGDTFSQYRVSYMILMGLGTKKKASEAMAWAVLASKSGHGDLMKYREAVAGQVPVKKRKDAERKATSYMRRWGPKDVLDDNSASVGASGTDCPGSRLARSCSSQGAQSLVQIAWGDDLSEDPAQMDLISELDRVIVENLSVI